eukprot:gene3534-3871_t
MSELSIEKKQVIPADTSPRVFLCRYLLFMAMGAGANWVFPTALSQQIPYFENHLPEGLCLATYMNATTNLGFLLVVVYLYGITQWRTLLDYHYAIPALLATSSIGCFLAAGVYSITVDGISLLLYVCCLVGGSVGCLAGVIMNPFMTSYENSYISAARSGGSGLILFTALLALAQNPGASHPRFSTAAYLSIFGALLIFPLIAYYYIIKYQIGLRPEGQQQQREHQQGEEGNVELETMTTNPVHHSALPVDSPPSSANSSASGDTVSTTSSSQNEGEGEGDERIVIDAAHVAHYKILYGPLTWLEAKLIPDSVHRHRPWLRQTLPYMITVGWVNFNTWGIICAMIPFAIANASNGSGSLNLSIAYQLSAFLLVLGDLSTTMIKFPIFPCVLIFTGCCFIVYAAALGAPGFQTSAAAPLLIMIYAIERFVEAHVVTSSYRAVATDIPLEYRQTASRAVGVCDQVSTAVGTLLSTLVVSLLFSCGS